MPLPATRQAPCSLPYVLWLHNPQRVARNPQLVLQPKIRLANMGIFKQLATRSAECNPAVFQHVAAI